MPVSRWLFVIYTRAGEEHIFVGNLACDFASGLRLGDMVGVSLESLIDVYLVSRVGNERW